MLNSIKNKINLYHYILCGAVLLGVGLRFYGLNHSGIIFYDEALYLNHSLAVLEFIERLHPSGWDNGLKAFMAYLHAPLSFTKPIWILIIDSRYFLTHVNDYDYAKYAAAFFGVLTLPLLFFFSRRFFKSFEVAVLSVVILALLPSHIFYARVGLQESFSICVVLAGFYCYLFEGILEGIPFGAGLFFALAYLANYRLIILPLLFTGTEVWFGLLHKEGVRWRHWIWTCLMFLAVMVVVGSLMDGANGRFVLAWVFHQGDMAVRKSSWVELFAYPYYLFRLENWLLAAAFFGSAFFIIKKNWVKSWPFAIACLQMLIFAMASDRGARYIAVVLPFVAMASAAFLFNMYSKAQGKNVKALVMFFVGVMLFSLMARSFDLVRASSDHAQAVAYMTMGRPDLKFVTSQDIVERLYVQPHSHAQALPEDFKVLQRYFQNGARYLVIDPQAYISFSGNDFKWGLPLKGYLGFIDKNIKPEKVFVHFNKALMERVVFEHSDNLFQSIAFLDSKELARMSMLRIYDLSTLVPLMTSIVEKAVHQ